MSYEVFALKYRPRRFQDVVGQEGVALTLRNAVASSRVAHALLFCGSRGTGKTSMARILAKALNCANVKDGEPCDTCDTCRLIGRGDDIDVIEIDGASNRGIDDVRGIKESVAYVPSRSRFKIFIIDEVHMLTIQAFNALLKVLEEPPPHVKFIFATTDPNNLPDTILSRCQRHEFRRIAVDDIVGRLADICAREGVEADEDALRAIAAKADGGLRDSVSLLDQVISYAGNRVVAGDLERAIGMIPREHIEGIVKAIADGDLGGVLIAVDRAHGSGFDPQELLLGVIGLLRGLMVWHASADLETDARRAAFFSDVQPALPMDRVLYLLRLFLSARGEIKRGGQERIQMELAVLKAARSTDFLPLKDVLDRLNGVVRLDDPIAAAPAARSVAPTSRTISAVPVEPPPAAAKTPPAPADAPAPKPQPAATFESIAAAWPKVLDLVRAASPVIGGYVADARPLSFDGRRLVLEARGDKKLSLQQLQSPAAAQSVADALRRLTGFDGAVAVVASEVSAQTATPEDSRNAYDDPAVRKIVDVFDGGIINVEKRDG